MIAIAILGFVMGSAVVGLAVLGLRQRRRTVSLQRRAHEAGLHFSADDTFDVPRRCAAFALCSAGHSPQATNMTYGRLRGLPLRAFDFRYEVGHGTRRATRHYGVILVEAPGPPVLLWNRQDAASAPPVVRQDDLGGGDWLLHGDPEQARRLSEALAPLAASGVSLEARAEGWMLCFPARARKDSYADWLPAASALIDALGVAAPAAAKARGAREDRQSAGLPGPQAS